MMQKSRDECTAIWVREPAPDPRDNNFQLIQKYVTVEQKIYKD
jgi:hypothetical protein